VENTVPSQATVKPVTAPSTMPAPATADDDQRFDLAGLEATLSLHRALGVDTKHNLFWSPFSVRAAMAMSLVGARGATAQQLAGALALPVSADATAQHFARLLVALESDDGAHRLHLANRLFVQSGFALAADFERRLDSSFGAAPRRLDFATDPERARRHINDWADAETRGHIKGLIGSGAISRGTRLVVANAVWFKGTWHSGFDLRRTRDGPFHLLDGTDVAVPMMRQRGDFLYASATNVALLKLPYRGGEASMIVLLPTANDGLTELEASLDAAQLTEWISRMAPADVYVELPRFALASSAEVQPALQTLGVRDALDCGPPVGADLSGMTGRKELCIGGIFHKAFVEVNEEGTEAAAATAVAIAAPPGAPQPPLSFAIDHPFVFLIRHERTGEILFLGRVTDPR
jgi:serpin B